MIRFAGSPEGAQARAAGSLLKKAVISSLYQLASIFYGDGDCLMHHWLVVKTWN